MNDGGVRILWLLHSNAYIQVATVISSDSVKLQIISFKQLMEKIWFAILKWAVKLLGYFYS